MIKIFNIILLLFFLLATCNGNSRVLCAESHNLQKESAHATIKTKHAVKTNSFSLYKLGHDEDNCDLCYDIPPLVKIINTITKITRNKKAQGNLRLDTIFVKKIFNYNLNQYSKSFLKNSKLNNHLQKLSTIILIV